ncbi:hypothetical protein BU17DRAFT_100806 [Hysterangium stoloniferum]|nr:hypothetical protein BU17DRAFT_100806 [Hysterangium stoloniferum]
MQSGRHNIRPSATKSKAPPKLGFADTAPPEVLGQIFLHCIPSSEKELRGISFIDAPLLLLQVCRSWRQIALETPNIWTSLDFTYPFRLDGRSIFQLWLSKAGALPVRITFDTNDYAPKPTEAGLMALFLKNFHRISSFSGVLGTCFADELMRSILPIRGSRLERFDIRDDTGIDEEQMSALEASIYTPQLRHFKMDGPWFLMPVLSFSPSMLQSFSLTRIEWEIPALPSLELIHLLGQCSNLKALEFTVCEETISDSLRESDRLVLARLRRLVLHVVFESPGTIMFFRTLQIPNVEHIEFRPEHDATLCRGARWMDVLLRRPLPHLRSLVLEHVNFSIRDPREPPHTDSFLALTSLESLQFDYLEIAFIITARRKWRADGLERHDAFGQESRAKQDRPESEISLLFQGRESPSTDFRRSTYFGATSFRK